MTTPGSRIAPWARRSGRSSIDRFFTIPGLSQDCVPGLSGLARLRHLRCSDWRGGVAPTIADIGGHGGDLIIVELPAESRHGGPGGLLVSRDTLGTVHDYAHDRGVIPRGY